MSSALDRRRSTTPIRWLLTALVIAGVVVGAMTCASGLAKADTVASQVGRCPDIDPLVQPDGDVAEHTAHRDHPDTRSSRDDRSDTPSGPAHHSAEAHPGMACVVIIDLSMPLVATSTTSLEVVVLESIPIGRSPEPDPPVPKNSSTRN